MSGGWCGFKDLLEVSNNFDNCICLSSRDEKFEDIIAAKTRDVTFLSSRSKLLRAFPNSNTSEESEQPLDNALKDYGDEITLKLLEKMTVKAFSQGHAVKALLHSHNETLDPEDVKMKQNILDVLLEYHNVEEQLRKYEACLKERETEHAAVRAEWDNILGTLRDAKCQEHQNKAANRGPLYMKLKEEAKRLEMLKWLVVRFMNGRTTYDWLEDPHDIFTSVLKVTKMDCSVDMLLRED